MKKKNFSEAQIVSILKEAQSGVKIIDVCRKYGISDATYYNWKSKYANMSVSDIKRLKELEEENRRLQKMYAELSIDHSILREVLEKKI